MGAINRYPYGVPTATSFIKVTGEDGVFYDLVNVSDSTTHIQRLIKEGYDAKITFPKLVPSCIMRDFTDGLENYVDVMFRDGGSFYHKA